MAWMGKILGGTVGWSFGGPLGAVIGAAIGNHFDQSSSESIKYQNTINHFYDCLFENEEILPMS